MTVILTGSGHPRQGDTLHGPGLDASLKSVVIKNTSRETRTAVTYYLKSALGPQCSILSSGDREE